MPAASYTISVAPRGAPMKNRTPNTSETGSRNTNQGAPRNETSTASSVMKKRTSSSPSRAEKTNSNESGTQAPGPKKGDQNPIYLYCSPSATRSARREGFEPPTF